MIEIEKLLSGDDIRRWIEELPDPSPYFQPEPDELPRLASGVAAGADRNSMLDEISTAKGDLLIATRGMTYGDRARCAVVEFKTPALFSNSLIKLGCNKNVILPEYLQIYLSSRKGSAELSRTLTGSTLTTINLTKLQNMTILVPSIQRQMSVVKLLAKAHSSVLAAQERLVAAEELYDAFAELSASDKYTLHLSDVQEGSEK